MHHILTVHVGFIKFVEWLLNNYIKSLKYFFFWILCVRERWISRLGNFKVLNFFIFLILNLLFYFQLLPKLDGKQIPNTLNSTSLADR